jgi:branched-chain amino acid transport system substrate-binding protein
VQGPAAAQFAAKDLGVKRCLVIDDTETYGKGMADAFAEEAQKQGVTVVGRTSWKKDAPEYVLLRHHDRRRQGHHRQGGHD